MLRKLRAVSTVAATALLTGCGLANSAGPSGGSQDTTPVRVGVVTGLTGAYVQLGQAQQRGADLAIKELNGKAGSHPISAIVRDDQIKPDQALEQSKTLVQVDKVDVLAGCVSAATTLAINQVAKQAGIPYLGTCQTERLNRKPDFGPYTFHIAPLPSQDINAIAPWAVKTLGKNVYFMQPDYAWGHEQFDAAQKAFPAAGGTVAGVSWAPLGTTDFTPYIPKIQAAHPDVLMVGAAGNDQVNFLKQANQFGLNKQTKIVQFLEDLGFDQQTGFDAIQGTYGATNFYWTVKDAGTQKFVREYQNAYGQPPSGYAAYVYNAVILAAKQVAANKYKPDDFAKSLAGANFDLAEGPMTIRSCDHQSMQPTYIVQGLSSAQAQSEGGSAQYGYRKVLETLPASESQAPPCSEVGNNSTG